MSEVSRYDFPWHSCWVPNLWHAACSNLCFAHYRLYCRPQQLCIISLLLNIWEPMGVALVPRTAERILTSAVVCTIGRGGLPSILGREAQQQARDAFCLQKRRAPVLPPLERGSRERLKSSMPTYHAAPAAARSVKLTLRAPSSR